jgi:hypothetical protein
VNGHVVSSEVVNQQAVLPSCPHWAAQPAGSPCSAWGNQNQSSLRIEDEGVTSKKFKTTESVKIVFFICVFNIIKAMLSNIRYDNSEYNVMPTFPWLVCLKTYSGYVKPQIIPNTIYNVISVININTVKFN